jgi:hypothetical protein
MLRCYAMLCYAVLCFIEVPGALAAYDLPDLAAAAVGPLRRLRALLLFSPTDALQAPLPPPAAAEMFAFAAAVGNRSAAAVRVDTACAAPACVVAALLEAARA